MLDALFRVFSLRFAGSIAGFGISLLLLAFFDPMTLGLFYVVDSTALLLGLLISFSVPAAVMPLRTAATANGSHAARDRVDQMLIVVMVMQVAVVLILSIIAVGFLSGWRFEGHWIYMIALAPIACARLFLFDFQRAQGNLMLAALLQDRKGRNIVFCAFLGGLVILDPDDAIRLDLALTALSVAALLPVLLGLVRLDWSRLLTGLGIGTLRAELPVLGRMVFRLAGYSVLVRAFPPAVLSMTGALAGAPAAATLGLVYSITGIAEMATGAARITLVKAVDHFTAGAFGAFNRAFVTSILFAVCGSLVAIAGFWTVGVALLDRFYDIDELIALETTVALMFAVTLIKAMSTFHEVFLKNIGDVRGLTWAYVLGSVAAFSLAAVLLPRIGPVGAAYAHLVIFTTVGVWSWIYVQQRYAAPRFSRTLILSIVHGIANRLGLGAGERP